MGIKFAIENVLIAPLKYKNWAEVITSVVKRQEPAQVILKDGIRIEALGDLKYLVREVYLDKPYTPPYLPLGENDLVVDIGANNGIFAVFAASRTRNTVYAFEPAPKTFEFLERNIRMNRLSNVIAHNSAVSDEVGSTKLLFHSASGGSGNVLFDPLIPDKLERHLHTRKYPNKPDKYFEVPTTTLQAIMDNNNLERIDFLKIDCEGSEGSILRATPREYLKRVYKIAIEFHDQLSQLSHDDIQKLLEDVGFTTKLKWNHKSPFGYIYAWQE